MNWEHSVQTYTLPYVKETASENLLGDPGSSTQCSLTTKSGGWEGGSGGRGHLCTCGWFMLLCGRGQHNIVEQLSSLKKKKLTHLKKTAVHRHKWAGGGNCLNGYYRGNWLKWNITCIIVLCQFRSFLNLGWGGELLWEREAAGNRGRKTPKWLPALCSLCGGQFKGLSRPHL